jgi:hypothetical protein
MEKSEGAKRKRKTGKERKCEYKYRYYSRNTEYHDSDSETGDIYHECNK